MKPQIVYDGYLYGESGLCDRMLSIIHRDLGANFVRALRKYLREIAFLRDFTTIDIELFFKRKMR